MKIIFVRTSESSVRSLKRVRCERKSYISLRESEMCEKHERSMRNYEICEWEVWIKGDMSEKVMCKKWSVCGVMWVEKVRGVWRDRGNVRCLEKCDKSDMCERRWEKCEKKCDM